jgi:hypothetical protein
MEKVAKLKLQTGSTVEQKGKGRKENLNTTNIISLIIIVRVIIFFIITAFIYEYV